MTATIYTYPTTDGENRVVATFTPVDSMDYNMFFGTLTVKIFDVIVS